MQTMSSPTRRRRRSEPIPAWGWHLIIGVLAAIFITLLVITGFASQLWQGATGFFESAFPALLILAVALVIYFLPSFVAIGTPRVVAILATNILLGWTGIGWAGALIWALAEQGTKRASEKSTPPPPLP